MKALQIKCKAVGNIGAVEFLDENSLVIMESRWAGEEISHKATTTMHTAEMMKTTESIRDLAMKIGE